VIESRICEGADCLKAALSSGMTSLQLMVATSRCGISEASCPTINMHSCYQELKES
jgi:hypothetical protein